jgi:hypothetical protein
MQDRPALPGSIAIESRLLLNCHPVTTVVMGMVAGVRDAQIVSFQRRYHQNQTDHGEHSGLPQFLRFYFFSPFSRVAAFLPARTAGGAVFGLNLVARRAFLMGVRRVGWV